MSKHYLIIHMHDIDPYMGIHDAVIHQTLQQKLNDGEIIGTLMQDKLTAEQLEAHIKEIVQDRTDVTAVLVYADYGYELVPEASDLVFVASLATSITGNRATSISYTYGGNNTFCLK